MLYHTRWFSIFLLSIRYTQVLPLIWQGRCHKERSGFEGAWTLNPLIFDNSYFKSVAYFFLSSDFFFYSCSFYLACPASLAKCKSFKCAFMLRRVSYLCYCNRELLSGVKAGLLQLPTDKALLTDPVFRPLVDKYAAVWNFRLNISFLSKIGCRF